MKTRTGPRKQQTPWKAAKCVVTQNLGEESPLSFWQPCPCPLGRLERKSGYCTNTRLESPEQAYFEITTRFHFGYTQFHFCFSPTDKRKITGLVSELAETAQGGPGRGRAPCAVTTTVCMTTSHPYHTHPHLTGGETEPSAPCPTPTGLPNFQPVTSAPYGLGPHGGKNRGDQTALPRAPAVEKGFLLRSDLFPLQLHRGVSRGERNRPGYRKGAKGGNRRRDSQVQRPLNTSTGGMAGLTSFSREAFQNRRLVCY